MSHTGHTPLERSASAPQVATQPAAGLRSGADGGGEEGDGSGAAKEIKFVDFVTALRRARRGHVSVL